MCERESDLRKRVILKAETGQFKKVFFRELEARER